jgi:hypothetical protein
VSSFSLKKGSDFVKQTNRDKTFRLLGIRSKDNPKRKDDSMTTSREEIVKELWHKLLKKNPTNDDPNCIIEHVNF